MVDTDSSSGPDVPLEAPEEDVAEQSAPLWDDGTPDVEPEPDPVREADPADVLEQSIDVPTDEGDESGQHG